MLFQICDTRLITTCGIAVPDESEIRSECLEHRKLSYDTVIDGSDEYISVFFYVSHHPDSDLCDLAGH